MQISDYGAVYALWLSCKGMGLNDVDDSREGIAQQLVETAMDALKACGIRKAALVAFSDNQTGNAFWERIGFTERTDLVYRNQALAEIRFLKRQPDESGAE